jgi:uncharacterized membrane protein
MFKRALPFIILFFVVILYTKPYFRPGFFSTHDGEWAIVRLAEMQRELKDKQFPPRWADYLNHGFGYPLFSYTYPFPFYLGETVRTLRISFVDTIKIIFVGSVFASAIFMFMLGRELAGNFAGFISALFYVVAPFRLVDLYVRGSIGESISLALFPALCFFSIKYILKPNLPRLVLCSVLLAVLILSHNIMALIFFPLWLIFLYVVVISYYEDIKLYSWRYFLPMILLGLGLSAYFFIPAILEKNFVMLSRVKLANPSTNFISLPQYLISPWSFDQPSYQLGWAHILGAVVSFLGLLFAKSIDKRKFLPLIIFLIGGILVLIFFTHPNSAEFWNVPPLSWLDFPWRLLTPLAFFLALSTIFLSLHKTTQIIGVILAIITVALSLKFAVPRDHINKLDSYYITNDATTTSMDELIPVWVAEKPKERYQTKVEVEKGKATISALEYNSNSIKFAINAKTTSIIKINTVYFPGWQFIFSGKNVLPNFGQHDGLMRFTVPTDYYQVIGKFTETPVRLWSDMLTLGSIVITVLLLIFSFISRLRSKFYAK